MKPCPECQRQTHNYVKQCAGCSVRNSSCAICLAPVDDITLGKRFRASVFAAEKRYDRALRKAERQFAGPEQAGNLTEASFNAGGLLMLRHDQLFEHLRVDLHYQEMAKRFK
jgi:hypothetical protein